VRWGKGGYKKEERTEPEVRHQTMSMSSQAMSMGGSKNDSKNDSKNVKDLPIRSAGGLFGHQNQE
jgi:hypothetical protein